MVLPALLLLVANLYWVSLLIGLVGTRFRDMTPIIANCVQVAFFVTPISWMPKLLSPDSLILRLNPLVYYIEIVRSPLLNIAPSLNSWIVAGSITVTGLTLSLLIFSSYRHRISFWVD
jgi:ABC-type polysaccharide/polyol phosphate export permease